MTHTPLVPVRSSHTTRDGEHFHRNVVGEATSSPHLAITAEVDFAGRFTGEFALTHTPTGYSVIGSDAFLDLEDLRRIATELAEHDWSSTDVDEARRPELREALKRATGLPFKQALVAASPVSPAPDTEETAR